MEGLCYPACPSLKQRDFVAVSGVGVERNDNNYGLTNVLSNVTDRLETR